ncbi:hypothetical protein SDRG_15158 [Saprolegnia diclina VS20]|uniref:DNA replication ATP-dependent helicase/nuclease n=1 Tax=Saprolegnia diclina (strain VS20) TaxID=1156394 RepID=T0PNR2_SAPDV|nr:hypothetical protein SDRG_15158 [Saprolegnia diclina VS20]EQC27044.1 hypothetical protein SDRG_15158 [Saprolegnia diclina VS20]|eukprot:XP_008619544.1 hypothetical protein SDRG_15158 [Saprolegnia diclina VS20]
MERAAIFGGDDDVAGASPMKDEAMGVVWKESPSDKKLKPSGASNPQVNATELQGFVTSLITSPSPNKKSQTSKLKFKKKIVGAPDGITRHIAFSPDKHLRPPTVPITSPPARSKRRKTGGGDEDQNLLSILQKMDDAYADSPEKGPPTTLPAPAPAEPPATTSTMPDVDMDDEEFTEEAWGILEEMEIQATQQMLERDQKAQARPLDASPMGPSRIVEPRSGMSPAVVPRNPLHQVMRPPTTTPAMPAMPAHSVQRHVQDGPGRDPARPVAPDTATTTAPPAPVTPVRAKPTDYIRLVALEAHTDHAQRKLLLRAIDDDAIVHDVVLADDWYGTPLVIGDTFNFIWTTPRTSSSLIASNAAHLVIVHPDILVSPTAVTSSLRCGRMAVLQQTLSMNQPSGAKALVGTMKHDLFERALQSGYHSIPYLIEQSQSIIQDSLLKCLESGITETQAAEEMRSSFQSMHVWLQKLHTSGVVVGNATLRLEAVLATEEPLWSIKYGLKGAVDATIRVLQNGTRKTIVPLELKTGKKAYALAEHHGQVLLYSLLLEERYRECSEGLLLYLLETESLLIAREMPIARALLQARNQHAANMAKYQGESVYPPMLRQPRDCGFCFSAAECMLHHASEEMGTAATSGAVDVFAKHTTHLLQDERAYFATWNRLVDLEFRSSQTAVQQLWLNSNDDRAANGSCLLHLSLANVTPKTLRLRSRTLLASTDLKFHVDDRVILSCESDAALLLHTAKGRITALLDQDIEIALFAPISRAVLQGDSVVGAHPHWRMDKDMVSWGLLQAKRNLAQLFVGPSPHGISAGVHPTRFLRPPLDPETDKCGDDVRRKLICRLEPPRFLAPTTTLGMLQAHAIAHPTSPRYEALYNDFLRMNPDQQRAIEKVLHAKDYALILGMPGTGKTSAITMCVRLLLHLGFSVLVTSYTHSAVDTLLLKLLEFNVPMLRVGSKDQVHARLQPHLLSTVCHPLRTTAAIETVMVNATLVGCTCLGTNHVLFSKRRFDYCIVDEASQITQPVLLGALRCADTFCLVGDHYQLPPLVTALKAKLGGLDVSLFKRLGEAHPSASVQLGYQYRMHPDIMLLCNDLIYNHQLKCGETSAHIAPWELSPLPLPHWLSHVLSPSVSVVFLDTDALGLHESRQSKGIVNPVEASAVLQVVRALQQAGAIDIGVLSPFRSQVHYLQTHHHGPPVEISTIDKYQGRDKDAIIVSFVRSNATPTVGELLLDWRRINVALTRAKKKLVLVGSPSTLAGSPVLRSLLELVQRQQWVLPLPAAATNVPMLPLSTTDVSGGAQRVYVHAPVDAGAIEGLAINELPRRAPLRPHMPVSRNILDETMG